MFHKLSQYLQRPALYAPSTGKFWDDEHISKGMLVAHLNPDVEAATRRHAFITDSVRWISQIAPPAQYGALLDLGCGPGLYAEQFYAAGYAVTGIDFSLRSIAYAKEQARLYGSNIAYLYQDYLAMEYAAQFDVATLIYCDYAALSHADRQVLLGKVRQALRPGGKFIFDVFTPRMRKTESHSWQYYAQGGFFSQEPHICLEAVYQYADDDKTELRQSVIITENTVNSYHIWDHFFTKETLLAELRSAGFQEVTLYGDVAGREFSEAGETICAVASR